MPGLIITGSENISFLDSQIKASLCTGFFNIDISPSIFINGGEARVLGTNVEIINPFGVTVKPYGPDYDISNNVSVGTIVDYPIPTQAGNYQYGVYTINVKLFDDDGNSYVVSKQVSICEPDKKNKTRKYGSLSAILKANCKDGKLYVIIDPVPTYKGVIASSTVVEGELEYPTSSELPVLEFDRSNFSVTLFEGVYKVTGTICATYNYGDNVSVDVLYKFKREKNVRCLLDECCVLSKLQELHQALESDCTQEEKDRTTYITFNALRLLKTAQLAAECGEDPSEYVEDLEALLGCKCTCNCLEGAPIIGTSPSSDVVVEGCLVSQSVNGLTTVYTINGYNYDVTVVPNGGVLTVTGGAVVDCVKEFQLTFNIGVAYTQIKALALSSGDVPAGNIEGDFWASVINKALRDVDPTCFGLNATQWQALTFAQKMSTAFTKFCACCAACGDTITNAGTAQLGADVHLTWKSDAYKVEVYLDGVLVGNYLSSAQDPTSNVFTHVFSGAADGQEHEWILIPKCADGSSGTLVSGTFQFLGCPAVAPPALSSDAVSGACPYDLTALVPVDNPFEVEWHNANNTNPGTLVSNPAAATGGTYYAFNKDENGCFSASARVTLICTEAASCTAPQNLTVGVFGANNFFVQFQSALYPPPGNSYTVLRRLASDPDVGGSYTTIGTPVWNASLSRWVIADLTAVDDTLYVYRAVSNCGETEPSVDFQYINVVCPALTLTPGEEDVDYEFVPNAAADFITVQIYDTTGVVLIQQTVFSPAYSNPTTGSFIYLSPGTNYKVRIILDFVGPTIDTRKTCAFQNVTTNPVS